MRRHLFLATAMLLLGRLEAAVACSYAPGYKPPSDDERFAKATAVFNRRVFRIEEVGLVSAEEAGLPAGKELVPPWPVLEVTFRVVEVFKGQPPPDGKVRAPRWYMCGGPLFGVGEETSLCPARAQLRWLLAGGEWRAREPCEEDARAG